MDKAFFQTFAGAVANKNCSADGCLTRPALDSDYCATHRDMRKHAAFGEPCEWCGSRQWVRTPDAESVAWCVNCEFVCYDESVFEDSW